MSASPRTTSPRRGRPTNGRWRTIPGAGSPIAPDTAWRGPWRRRASPTGRCACSASWPAAADRTGSNRAWLQVGSIELAAGRPAEAVEALDDAGAHRPLEPTERRSAAPARPGASTGSAGPTRPDACSATSPPTRPARSRRRPRSSWRRSSWSTIAPRSALVGGRRRARAQRPLPLAAGAPVPVGRGPAAARPPGGGAGAIPPGRRDRTR